MEADARGCLKHARGACNVLLFCAANTLVDGIDSLPLMQAGSIKAYAVASDTRVAIAPDIPTFAEMAWSALSYSMWFGLFAPRRTPRNIIGKLNTAAVEAMADPAVRSRLGDLGMEIFPRSGRRRRHSPRS